MRAPYFTHGVGSLTFGRITVTDGDDEQEITAEQAWEAFRDPATKEEEEDWKRIQAKLETDGVQRKLKAELDLWWQALLHVLPFPPGDGTEDRRTALVLADWAAAQYIARAEALGIRL